MYRVSISILLLISFIINIELIATDDSLHALRVFDLPEEAPRARMIVLNFSQSKERVKVQHKNKKASKNDDFTRFQLGKLSDEEMRSSSEVKHEALRRLRRIRPGF